MNNSQKWHALPDPIFSRVSQAVKESRCAEAILLLLQFLPSVGNDQNKLVSALAGVGDALDTEHNPARAEEYFRLSLSLYNKCLPDAHDGVIYSLRRLCDTLKQQKKFADLDVALRDCDFVIRRVARSILGRRQS